MVEQFKQIHLNSNSPVSLDSCEGREISTTSAIWYILISLCVITLSANSEDI